MAEKEQQLEDLELIFENQLVTATIQQLMELAQGLNLATTNMTRKTQLMKALRKYAEGTDDASEDDRILTLTNVNKAFATVKTEPELKPVEEDAKLDQATGGGATPKEPTTSDSFQKFMQSLSSASVEFKRPLKIVGVVAAQEKDKNNGISYINLSSQIADAKSNYKEEEIVRAVKKSVSLMSPLRTYFDTQENLKLEKMLEILRNYYHEKDSNELFTELSQLGQKNTEKPTEFLIRAMELRQRLTSAAAAENAAFDLKLINNTFARACRTGFNNSTIRQHMRPFFNMGVNGTGPDDTILLKELNIAMAENEETTSKMKNATPKKLTINEASTSATATTSVADALKPLVESMNLLKQEIKDIKSTATAYRGRGTYSKKFDGRCQKCKEKDYSNCKHCFKCGSEDHMQRNCPKN